MTVKVREWNGAVIFLHEVARGAADRSYGVQVARLAGLPEPVVERAREVLQKLEAGETASPAARLADDLPLFSVAMRAEKPALKRDDALERAVADLLPSVARRP